MKYLIAALLFTVAARAQDYDRLTIRPMWDSGTEAYVSGKINWAEEDAWPNTAPETVSLRSPESGLTGHNLTLPEELPPEKYCLMVDSVGQMALQRCRFSTFAAKTGHVTLLDYTDDNFSCYRPRIVSDQGTDPKAHWIGVTCQDQQHFSVAFLVTDGIPSDPDLTFWAYSSASIGTPTYEVKRHCSTPDDGDTWADAWDATYTPSHTYGAAGHLQTVDFTQTSWTPVAGDLCIFDIKQTSSASITYFLIGQVN